MNLRIENTLPEAVLHFLKQCYKFVNEEWQHVSREQLPDQGFERRFRESCVIRLKEWRISQEREMHLGSGLDTPSGVFHEVDLVAQHSDLAAIVEIKNRQGTRPEKNDIIIFFAKILDYPAFNPTLLLKEGCPTFISNTPFEESGLAACLGLGIHPVAPDLRPLPILIDTTRRMNSELQKGLFVAPQIYDQFKDLCSQLNRISSTLSETWLTCRCGYQSEHTIVLKAVGGLHTFLLSQEFRQLNSDCTRLLNEFKLAKKSREMRSCQ